MKKASCRSCNLARFGGSEFLQKLAKDQDRRLLIGHRKCPDVPASSIDDEQVHFGSVKTLLDGGFGLGVGLDNFGQVTGATDVADIHMEHDTRNESVSVAVNRILGLC